MKTLSKPKPDQRLFFGGVAMGQRCVAVARATCATEFIALLWIIALRYGPRFAAELMGTRWELCVGHRASHHMLRRLINRLANVGLAGQDRACWLIGRALMTPADLVAFRIVMRNTRHQLYRETNLTASTGWFRTREEAHAMWKSERSKPAIAVDTISFNSVHILAVKLTAGGLSEFVPEPGRDVPFEREFLR